MRPPSCLYTEEFGAQHQHPEHKYTSCDPSDHSSLNFFIWCYLRRSPTLRRLLKCIFLRDSLQEPLGPPRPITPQLIGSTRLVKGALAPMTEPYNSKFEFTGSSSAIDPSAFGSEYLNDRTDCQEKCWHTPEDSDQLIISRPSCSNFRGPKLQNGQKTFIQFIFPVSTIRYGNSYQTAGMDLEVLPSYPQRKPPNKSHGRFVQISILGQQVITAVPSHNHFVTTSLSHNKASE